MTYWYVFSLDTEFSEGKLPLSSDIVLKSCQNSRSVIECLACAVNGRGVAATAATAHSISVRATRGERPDERGITTPDVKWAQCGCMRRWPPPCNLGGVEDLG